MLSTSPLRLVAVVLALGTVGCASTAPVPNEAPKTPLVPARLSVVVPIAQAPGFQVCRGCEELPPTRKTLVGSVTSGFSPSNTQVLAPLSPGQAASPRVGVATVHFGIGSAKLDAQGRASLARFLAALQPALDAGTVLRVAVAGYTDNTGSLATNTRLADARAQGVAEAVRSQVPSDQVSLEVHGAPLCCYVADNASAAGRAANRRVSLEARAIANSQEGAPPK